MNKIIKLKNPRGSKIELVQRDNIVQANECYESVFGMGKFVKFKRYFSEERTIEDVTAFYESVGFKKVSA